MAGMVDPIIGMIRDKIGLATAVAIALAIAGAALLYLNQSDSAVLNGIAGAYTATWIAFICGAAFAVMSLGFQLCVWAKGCWDKRTERVTRERERKQYEEHVLSMLDLLSPEEEQTLAWMVQNMQNTVIGETSTRVLHALVAKGLLKPAPGTGELFNWPHRPPDFVWNELQQQRDRFMAVKVDGYGDRRPWPSPFMRRCASSIGTDRHSRLMPG